MERYNPVQHQSAVGRFNAKLKAAGSEFQFPIEEPSPGAAISFEHFVAAADGEVLGGYLLKHQKFFLKGEPLDVENLQLPLSLGLIDRRFTHVSTAILFEVLGRNEFIYCLGLGSQESNLARMLSAAGWRCLVVPFYFSVKSGNRFARNIRLPAHRSGTQRMLRVAGHLRLAGLGLSLMGWKKKQTNIIKNLRTSVVPRFGEEADRLFQENLQWYSLLGDRRSAALNDWYPENNPKFIRLLVQEGERSLGWAVLLDTVMQDHKYFGNLRAGTLADCLARPEDAPFVVAAADRYLGERGVDLVVSNQLHPSWVEALKQAGYRSGPSNFFFYFSPGLAERLEQDPHWEQGIHLNRGDGDGPIHL